MPSIRNIPIDEQPREKLIKQGPKYLADSELLAIILRVGNKGKNVIELSREILQRFSIRDLSEIDYSQIIKFNGIKKAKAAQVIACFELARRLAEYKSDSLVIKSSKDIAEMLIPELRYKKKEHLMGIYLDNRNKIIRKETVSIGTVDTSLIHPREIFMPAIESGAKSVIIVHNHPSGNPTPSKEDIMVTKKIINAGELLGIEIIDHIIIGDNEYSSFKDKGIL